MISTIAPINKLIYGRVATLPIELQKIILLFACCHPCAELVKNNADYISKFIKPKPSIFSSFLSEYIIYIHIPAWSHSSFQEYNVNYSISIIYYKEHQEEKPIFKRKKNCQQNNLIKAQRKQLYRRQKPNNRSTKRIW